MVGVYRSVLHKNSVPLMANIFYAISACQDHVLVLVAIVLGVI